MGSGVINSYISFNTTVNQLFISSLSLNFILIMCNVKRTHTYKYTRNTHAHKQIILNFNIEKRILVINFFHKIYSVYVLVLISPVPWKLYSLITGSKDKCMLQRNWSRFSLHLYTNYKVYNKLVKVSWLFVNWVKLKYTMFFET